jgi:hypothetical protein
LRGLVDLVESRGHDYLLHLRLDHAAADPFLVIVTGTSPPPIGAHVGVRLPPDRVHLFDGRTGARQS